MTDRIKDFNIVMNQMKKNKVVIIQGLRRIGKTILMKSVAKDSMFDTYEKLTFDVGIFGQDDKQVALDYLEVVKNSPSKTFLLIIDEFQDLVDWDKYFKTLHLLENVKVIATGSISANKEMIQNTEGGRFGYVYMNTLSFNQFKNIYHGIGLSDSEYFIKFASMGSYPEQEFNENITEYKKQVNDNIIEKIKSSKLLKEAGIDNPQHVNNILLFMIENIGNTTSNNSISKKLSIDVRTVSKIISYLKQTFILYEVANSFQSKGKAAQNNVKYYLTDHTFYLFVKQSEYHKLPNSKFKDMLFENIIFNEVRKEYSKHEVEIRFEKKNKADIDMTLTKNDKKKYFEIKNTENKTVTKEQKIFSENNKLSVIYKGETKQINGIDYINYIEFIKDVKKWI